MPRESLIKGRTALGVSNRTRWLSVSKIYNPPEPFGAIARGKRSGALVAATLSGLSPKLPLPAIRSEERRVGKEC